MYEIIDIQTRKRVGRRYASLSEAHARADELDNEYGAVRYIVRRREG